MAVLLILLLFALVGVVVGVVFAAVLAIGIDAGGRRFAPARLFADLRNEMFNEVAAEFRSNTGPPPPP